MLKLFKKTEDDSMMFGEKRVQIPKLTIARWKQLIDKVEILPKVILDVFSSRHSSDFVVTLIAALTVAIDESVELIAELTGLPAEWIIENVDHNELTEFITRTIKKNDLIATAKKLLAVFAEKPRTNPANP